MRMYNIFEYRSDSNDYRRVAFFISIAELYEMHGSLYCSHIAVYNITENRCNTSDSEATAMYYWKDHGSGFTRSLRESFAKFKRNVESRTEIGQTITLEELEQKVALLVLGS